MSARGSLVGRSILITGAASGIGRATAERFARQGAKLLLLDRARADVERLAYELGVEWVAVDLASPAEAAEHVKDAVGKLGELDGVVNSAGIPASARLENLSLQDWELAVAVNLTAPYAICRAVLPWLRAGEKATIVNVASALALLPNTSAVSAYAATKAGLLGLTKALAAELGPSIRVNAVCPGFTRTPMAEPILETEAGSTLLQQYALKRIAAPAEIAEAILFLTSDASSFVTGISLAADGGRSFH